MTKAHTNEQNSGCLLKLIMWLLYGRVDDPVFRTGLGYTEAKPLQQQVSELVKRGQKGKAIRLVHDRTGHPLRDAKFMVKHIDAWEIAMDSVPADEARDIPPNVRQAVLDRDDYISRYCGRRSQTMEVDHVIPVSQGGA